MSLWQDLRYAARGLAQQRSFTLMAVLTLALGIGATTAAFNALYAVLLRPLPFPQPERMVFLSGAALNTGNFDAWRQQARSYEPFAALSPGPVTLTGRGDAERLGALTVTPEMFSVLGIRPVVGRGFVPEDRLAESAPVVVVSAGFWETRLGRAADVLGQVLVLDRTPHTIVGVLPPEMGPLPYRNMALWLPLRPARARGTSAIARLAAGATLQSARAEAEALAAQFVRPEEQRPGRPAVTVTGLKDQIVFQYRDSLLVLAGAVFFVLLIGTVNVANLQLARGAERLREMAIRSALGASRWRLMQQALAESFLLAAAGAAAGLLVAQWSLTALRHFLPYDVPRLGEAGIGGGMLLICFLLLCLSTLLTGLIPAVRSTRVEVSQAMQAGGGRTTAGGGRRLLRVLVVAEAALALVMLIGAGLLLKTFLVLRPTSPGFAFSNRLTLQVDLPRYRYADRAQQAAFFRDVQAQVAALPGVHGVAGVTDLPFTGMSAISDIRIDGKIVAGPSAEVFVHLRQSTDDFFRVMGIGMAAGRDFAPTDDSRQEKVAIINQTMARRFWPERNPIGQRVYIVRRDGEEGLSIIGIVNDARIWGSSSSPSPELYQPFAQSPWSRLKLVVLTAGDPLAHVAAVRGVVRRMDAEVLVSEIHSLEQLLDDSVAEPRFQAVLIGGFAGLALLLALVGVHGVLAYWVSLRRREIGIRLALGAQPAQVLRMILSEGVSLTLTGAAIGVGVALWLAPLLRSLLYEVQPADPQALTAATLLWCGVAALACAIPARRAARVDPLAILRHE